MVIRKPERAAHPIDKCRVRGGVRTQPVIEVSDVKRQVDLASNLGEGKNELGKFLASIDVRGTMQRS